MNELNFLPSHLGRLCDLLNRVQSQRKDNCNWGFSSTDQLIDEIEAAVDFFHEEWDRRRGHQSELGEMIRLRREARMAKEAAHAAG
jgi:hypothetical protein